MRSFHTLSALGLTALAVALAGCPGESGTTGPDTSPGPETALPPPTVEIPGLHENAHPSEGPHHGGLIELGNEEYHGELLHDEQSGTVTIYVLDGTATKQVPIDAQQVTINAVHDGQPRQFNLAAAPDADDPQGTSSRFTSDDAELGNLLDAEDAQLRLALTINGKAYNGRIVHDHDHDHAHNE